MSAYQTYEDYYKGVEATLIAWMNTKLQSDMDTLATDISPSAQATVDGLVSEVTFQEEQVVTTVEAVPAATDDSIPVTN